MAACTTTTTTTTPSEAPSPVQPLSSLTTLPLPLLPLSPEDLGSSAVAATVEASPADALPVGEAALLLEQGGASWYGRRFHGRRTASGERYDMHALTAAHRTLPFGALVRVRSLTNGKEVDVRITDRGPSSQNRVIDLSRAAAEALGMLGMGVKEVLLLVPGYAPPVIETPAVTEDPCPMQTATGSSAQ